MPLKIILKNENMGFDIKHDISHDFHMLRDKEVKRGGRHDLHKLSGIGHDSTDAEHTLPNGVDMMSRKMSCITNMKKVEKVDPDEIQVNNYRLSIITGESMFKHGREERELINEKRVYYENTTDTAEVFYQELLKCQILSKFNEAVIDEETWFPYTSLKYHTILATNLHLNMNLPHNKFEDLYFRIVDKSDVENIFNVVFIDEGNKKCFTIDNGKQNTKYEATTKIGIPMMNFGDVMGRLKGDVYIDKQLYANLRRIQSWSIGLQYLEDMLLLQREEVVDLYKGGA